MDLCSQARAFWELYFHAATWEEGQMLLEQMAPSAVLIGTGIHELYRSRNAFRKDLRKTVDDHRELTFSIGTFTAEEHPVSEDVRLVCGRMDISGAARSGGTPVNMQTRYTMVFCRDRERWQVCHIHNSVPFQEQDPGEYYPRSLYQQLEEVRTLANAMTELAQRDGLTGLYNLRTLGELFDRSTGTDNWLVLTDLDNFKKVNDFCGHMKGNEVLKQIAGVLRGSIRGDDAAARIGGDEFVLLCRGLRDGDMENLLRRLLDQVNGLEFHIPISISMSMGAVNVLPGESLSDAMRRADQRMYAAKRIGKRCFCMENPRAPLTEAQRNDAEPI